MFQSVQQLFARFYTGTMSRRTQSRLAASAAPPPRSPQAVLDALTQALVEQPGASLAELAALVGVGRTTLHRLYPTRQAVLRAVAQGALARLRQIDEAVGLPAAFAPPLSAAESWTILRRWIEELVPQGPRLMFLLRTHELDGDEDIQQATGALDATLHAALARAQAAGDLPATLSPSWLVASLHALVYVAFEQVAAGTLARRDAAPLVFQTWLGGVGGTGANSPARIR